MSIQQALYYAARAVTRECFGFRFQYPVQEVPQAGPVDSLHYYIWSDRLFLDDMQLDAAGIPQKVYRRQGPQHNPLFIAWRGLHYLERYLRNHDPQDLETCLAQIRWLTAHAEYRADGAVVWPCHFEWREGRCVLESGWISAMYQGVVVSLLVRGFRLTKDQDLLDLSMRAVQVFHQSVSDGGVQTIECGAVLYEEYPAYPLPRVLDGFLFSLLGLYDLAVQTGSSGVWALFHRGIEGLEKNFDLWDYRGKWSWYGTHGYICPPHYHGLNNLLIVILSRLTGKKILAEHATCWDPRRLTWLDKVEVYLMFIVLKNVARVRLPKN